MVYLAAVRSIGSSVRWACDERYAKRWSVVRKEDVWAEAHQRGEHSGVRRVVRERIEQTCTTKKSGVLSTSPMVVTKSGRHHLPLFSTNISVPENIVQTKWRRITGILC